MLASPLFVGADLRSANDTTLAYFKNADVIAVNQDPLGLQATQLVNDGTRWVFSKRLSNGDRAVALYNQSGSATTITTTAGAVGMPQSSAYTLKNLWTKGSTSTTGSISATVPAHGTVVFRVAAAGTRTGVLQSIASGRCLDNPGSTNSTQFVIYDCNGGTNQQWRMQSDSTVVGVQSGLCLDVADGMVDKGNLTKVVLWSCHGQDNQRWKQI
ncbi:ricin-type beta-trefoil lectin domain protein [Micromonosporaceae bacterium Da 78-11]